MTGAAIVVRNVSKRFGSHQAVDGVTLDVPTGKSAVILGLSGCGKTTLLRLIAGLETPDHGEIWFREVQVAGPGRSLLPPYQREVGFVFQDLALWPHLSVGGNLTFVLDALKVPRAERQRRIDDALKLVRIEGFAPRWTHELSGGEQQRVALAVHWSAGRGSSCWTNRFRAWMRTFVPPFARNWPISSERWG